MEVRRRFRSQINNIFQLKKTLIDHDPIYKQYVQNRLETIRINWVTLMFFLKSIVFVVGCILCFEDSEIWMLRSLILSATFFCFVGLEFLIARYQAAARYSGIIITVILVLVMTEMNIALEVYR